MGIGRLLPVFAVLIFAATPALSGGPRIDFDNEVIDYGKVRYGETVSEEFVFSNTGDQTLVIEKLRSSCGCTKAVKGSSEVPPGGKSNIVAAFDTTGLRAGKKEQHVFVESNDPERHIVKLTVLADVVKDLNVEPPSIARRLPNFVETVSFPLKITNTSDKAFTVKGVKSETGGLRASLNPASFAVQPHSTAPFTLSLKLRNEPGQSHYMGEVNLETDHPKESELDVRYFIKFDEAK
jgi:hypothetical protein